MRMRERFLLISWEHFPYSLWHQFPFSENQTHTRIELPVFLIVGVIQSASKHFLIFWLPDKYSAVLAFNTSIFHSLICSRFLHSCIVQSLWGFPQWRHVEVCVHTIMSNSAYDASKHFMARQASHKLEPTEKGAQEARASAGVSRWLGIKNNY